MNQEGLSKEARMKIWAFMIATDPKLKEASIAQWSNPDYELTEAEQVAVQVILECEELEKEKASA